MSDIVESLLNVAAPGGAMTVYRARPLHDWPVPAVIMYMDAVGFRRELQGMANLVAKQGYECWLPDLYYRDGGPSFNPRTPREDLEKFAPLMRKLTRDVVLGDTRAVLSRMNDEPLVARGDKGCVGFCMGGRFAMWAAGAFPEDFTAAASLHGGQLGSDAPDSPHRYAKRMRCEVYLGFASDDPLVPPEHVRTIENALREAGVRFESQTYPGTEHGYVFPERFCYDERAASASWSKIFALFARRLRQPQSNA